MIMHVPMQVSYQPNGTASAFSVLPKTQRSLQEVLTATPVFKVDQIDSTAHLLGLSCACT